MTPTPTTTTPLTAPIANPAASTAQTNAAQQLAGNFDTFLTLLTTQLRNQDPTAPLDSAQFTQQLVQFSQVEQQINTNDNLKTLIGQGQSATGAYAVSYLGRAVTVTNGQAALANGTAQWNYTLGTTAAASTLTVVDAQGTVVDTLAGETAAGAHSFRWDGKDANGNQLPDGTYTLRVAAQAADGSSVQAGVSSKGVVSEVDMSSGTPRLMIGPMAVPLSAVNAVGAS